MIGERKGKKWMRSEGKEGGERDRENIEKRWKKRRGMEQKDDKKEKGGKEKTGRGMEVKVF